MASAHCSSSSNAQASSENKLTRSASFRGRRKPASPLPRPGSEADDFLNLLHGSDPVRIELTRLENEVRDKERELGEAHAEIKSLKYSERLKEKAVEELTSELGKVDEKLKKAEALLESKNLEIKKISDEKRAALAAQFAAEATLRRVHAAQKDDDLPPIEAIIAPLEAELKLARLEVAKLQDDNRAFDRLTKSKEAALLEAEHTVEMALAKAAFVDDLQNRNQELMKQIEICQEENKILDRMHRQKVAEVEKLTQTVRELEEAVLAGGTAANAVRDYQRKLQEINEEKRLLDRELARAKVSANRVAVVVANEWKDSNEKVMPVKQWLEERRFFQGEMQQLRDKLAVAERTAKAEAQLKEKYQLRFKVLEERMRSTPTKVIPRTSSSSSRSVSHGRTRRQSFGGVDAMPKPSLNGFLERKPNTNTPSFSLKKGTNLPTSGQETKNVDGHHQDHAKLDKEDYVSGTLYDMLQKEVISLRKVCKEKDQMVKDKDDAIEMLARKVETLNKAMETESKRMRREVAAMEKELASLRVRKEQEHKTQRSSSVRK